MEGKSMERIISAEGAPKRIGSYSLAIKAGDFLFLSGNIGFDPKTMKMVSDDITLQTKQVMENVKAVLATAGVTFADVVKTTIFLKHLEDLPLVNEVYRQYFGEDYPARAMVQIAGIAEEAKLEMDAIAYLPEANK